MKHLNLFFAACLLSLGLQAETVWHNPQTEKLTGVNNVHNQGFNESNYQRLPASAEAIVRKPVWSLSRHSAGLAVRFRTDAKDITVRYGVTGGWNMPHMPTTGVSGLDLYRVNADGSHDFCAGTYRFADTARYKYKNDLQMVQGPVEYVLYLPLYNGVKWLEVGVDESCSFSFIAADPKVRPVVVYGTSCTQGACSSRPGNAWTNILNRRLHVPVINLGFSGNGIMEPEMIEQLAAINARVYVLDNLPNLDHFTEDTITHRVVYAVHRLRKTSNAPIVLVEHPGYSSDKTNIERHNSYRMTNRALSAAYKQLRSEKVKGLYYVTSAQLNYDPDGIVDVVHPNDIAMRNEADGITPTLKKVLKKYKN